MGFGQKPGVFSRYRKFLPYLEMILKANNFGRKILVSMGFDKKRKAQK